MKGTMLSSYHCKDGHETEMFYHTSGLVAPTVPCQTCGQRAQRDLIGRFCVYGTDKFSDSGFRDASEASGERITNTKQVDKLEKAGLMQAVTCPSQHRKWKKT